MATGKSRTLSPSREKTELWSVEKAQKALENLQFIEPRVGKKSRRVRLARSPQVWREDPNYLYVSAATFDGEPNTNIRLSGHLEDIMASLKGYKVKINNGDDFVFHGYIEDWTRAQKANWAEEVEEYKTVLKPKLDAKKTKTQRATKTTPGELNRLVETMGDIKRIGLEKKPESKRKGEQVRRGGGKRKALTTYVTEALEKEDRRSKEDQPIVVDVSNYGSGEKTQIRIRSAPKKRPKEGKVPLWWPEPRDSDGIYLLGSNNYQAYISALTDLAESYGDQISADPYAKYIKEAKENFGVSKETRIGQPTKAYKPSPKSSPKRTSPTTTTTTTTTRQTTPAQERVSRAPAEEEPERPKITPTRATEQVPSPRGEAGGEQRRSRPPSVRETGSVRGLPVETTTEPEGSIRGRAMRSPPTTYSARGEAEVPIRGGSLRGTSGRGGEAEVPIRSGSQRATSGRGGEPEVPIRSGSQRTTSVRGGSQRGGPGSPTGTGSRSRSGVAEGSEIYVPGEDISLTPLSGNGGGSISAINPPENL